jgi:hypothetical protein
MGINLDSLHLQAQDFLNLLESHPALGSPIFDFFSLFHLSINLVCKRGYIESPMGIRVYWNKENYKKFKKEFDQEFKHYSKKELKLKNLVSIDVPYEKLFGEKWAPDHIEYWGGISFVAFMGNNFKDEIDLTKWQRLSGLETSGESFQDLIVKIGGKFKKIYGDFSSNDFYTDREKKNNRGEKMFLCKEKTPTGTVMHRNPKYIHLSAGEINRRWWRWFSKTAYCKKNWNQTAKTILAGKDSLQ